MDDAPAPRGGRLALLRCAAAQVRTRLRGNVWRRFRMGVALTSGQVAPYRAAWEAANDLARAGDGPLWVVLGDSAAQGVGASDHGRGYVGQLRERLEARDGVPWRVLNLSVSGARAADVVGGQLPLLTAVAPAPDLVTCLIGGNDLLRTRVVDGVAGFRALLAGLPSGAVIGTVPQGRGGRRARTWNALIRSEAPAAGLRVADLWAHTGPPWQGRFAEDMFHPNDLGYRDWADAVAAALGLPVTGRTPAARG